MEYSCQEELTLCDLHLWEVEEAFIAHVALTATEKHLRAVLLLYAIIPATDESKKVHSSWFCLRENKCSSLKFLM